MGVELADTTARLQKAEAKLPALQAAVDTLRKETEAQKIAVDQLRSEVASAKAFFEAEKESGVRLRDELARTKELLMATIKSRMPTQAVAPPMLVRPAPMRVLPAGSGVSIGAGIPAR